MNVSELKRGKMFFLVGLIFLIGLSVVFYAHTGDMLQPLYFFSLPLILLVIFFVGATYEKILLKENYYIHQSVFGTKKINYRDIKFIKLETISREDDDGLNKRYRYINIYNSKKELLNQFSNAFFTLEKQRVSFLQKALQQNPDIQIDGRITNQQNAKSLKYLFPIILIIFVIAFIYLGMVFG